MDMRAFLSIPPCQGGEGELALDLAVAGLPHREAGGLRGLALLLLEQFALVGVGGLGVDHLQHPTAEDLEGLGVVVLGQGDQVLGAPFPQVGLVGQGVDGGADHCRLLGEHVACGHRLPQCLVLLERGRQADALVGRGPGGVRGVGVPAGDAGVVEGVGVGEDPGFQLGGPVHQMGQLDQGVVGLGQVQGPRRGVGHCSQRGLRAHDRGRDRVSRCRIVGLVGHGTTQAPATDSPISESRSTTGVVDNQLVPVQWFRDRR